MARRLVDRPLGIEDYVEEYLNDSQVKEQMFRVGREGFENKGPGVVVVDLRRLIEQVVRFYYLSAGQSGTWQDGDMEQVCRSYDPQQEVIIFLFFGEFSPKNECYKLALDDA